VRSSSSTSATWVAAMADGRGFFIRSRACLPYAVGVFMRRRRPGDEEAMACDVRLCVSRGMWGHLRQPQRRRWRTPDKCGFSRRRVCLPMPLASSCHAGEQEAMRCSACPVNALQPCVVNHAQSTLRWSLHAMPEIRKPCVAHRAQSTLRRPKAPSGPTQLEAASGWKSNSKSARHSVSFLLRKSLDILFNSKLGKSKQNNLKLAI
jgi:hypothetical protein